MSATDASRGRARRLRAAGAVCLLSGVLALSGCAAKRYTVAAGPRTPAPDGAAIWRDVSRACRAVRTYSATFRPGGRIGGDRIPAGLAVQGGLDDAGRIRLEGRALGRLLFTLAGSSEQAILVLHQEREFVNDRAAGILDALLGVPFDPARLLAVFTGCAASADASEAHRVGDQIEIVTADARVYLEREGELWRPRVAFTGGMQVDYAARQGGFPSEVRIWSVDAPRAGVELRVRIDAVVVNSVLPEEAFSVPVPAGATEVSLDDLRRALREGRR